MNQGHIGKLYRPPDIFHGKLTLNNTLENQPTMSIPKPIILDDKKVKDRQHKIVISSDSEDDIMNELNGTGSGDISSEEDISELQTKDKIKYVLLHVIDFGEYSIHSKFPNRSTLYFLIEKDELFDDTLGYFESWNDRLVGKDEAGEYEGAKEIYNIFCKGNFNNIEVNMPDFLVDDAYLDNVAMLYKDYNIVNQYNLHVYSD